MTELKIKNYPIYPQDLHIHTVYSTGDGSIVQEQTPELIASIKHAKVIGISDHFEFLNGQVFDEYQNRLRSLNIYVGTEVNGGDWVSEASEVNVDYYLYHCRDRNEDYKGVETLLKTGKPLIIAHPYIMGTDLNRIPDECFIEINNRYIWRTDWEFNLKRYIKRFRFVLSSDAHQPNWLSLTAARYVADKMDLRETILFKPKFSKNRVDKYLTHESI